MPLLDQQYATTGRVTPRRRVSELRAIAGYLPEWYALAEAEERRKGVEEQRQEAVDIEAERFDIYKDISMATLAEEKRATGVTEEIGAEQIKQMARQAGIDEEQSELMARQYEEAQKRGDTATTIAIVNTVISGAGAAGLLKPVGTALKGGVKSLLGLGTATKTVPAVAQLGVAGETGYAAGQTVAAATKAGTATTATPSFASVALPAFAAILPGAYGWFRSQKKRAKAEQSREAYAAWYKDLPDVEQAAEDERQAGFARQTQAQQLRNIGGSAEDIATVSAGTAGPGVRSRIHRLKQERSRLRPDERISPARAAANKYLERGP